MQFLVEAVAFDAREGDVAITSRSGWVRVVAQGEAGVTGWIGNTVRFRAAFGISKRRPDPAQERAGKMQQKPPASWRARQLALAYSIDREIEAGRFKTYAEVAGRRISRARVSQIAGMVLLPVGVQGARFWPASVTVSEQALQRQISRLYGSISVACEAS